MEANHRTISIKISQASSGGRVKLERDLKNPCGNKIENEKLSFPRNATTRSHLPPSSKKKSERWLLNHPCREFPMNMKMKDAKRSQSRLLVGKKKKMKGSQDENEGPSRSRRSFTQLIRRRIEMIDYQELDEIENRKKEERQEESEVANL